MKTFLAFICIILLVFSLAGCSKQAAKEPENVTAPAAPVEQPPAEPVAAAEPAAPAAPETKPAASVTAQLTGNWSLEKQVTWNTETKTWEPGIPLDDGSLTDVPPDEEIMELAPGLDKDWCAGVEQEGNVEYISMIPGGCFKVAGSALEEVGVPPEAGITTVTWVKSGENLELTFVFKDETGAELSRDKSILSPVK